MQMSVPSRVLTEFYSLYVILKKRIFFASDLFLKKSDVNMLSKRFQCEFRKSSKDYEEDKL